MGACVVITLKNTAASKPHLRVLYIVEFILKGSSSGGLLLLQYLHKSYVGTIRLDTYVNTISGYAHPQNPVQRHIVQPLLTQPRRTDLTTPPAGPGLTYF